MIKRSIEETIVDASKHFPIILVSGPRQIGKSTLLYNVLLPRGYSYVTFDDSLELSLAKKDPKTFLDIHPSPLIIDEAQRAPEIFPELEKIVNESRLTKGNQASNGMYILSGSQRQTLLEKAKESLSGRAAIIDMSNLSVNEIKERASVPFLPEIKVAAKRSQDYEIDESEAFKMIVRGFFPGLYDDLEIKSSLFYSSYLTTYIEKDLRELISISNESKFLDFIKILASNTGEELIYDNYSKHVGIAVNTVKSWVSILAKTGIIFLVEPYNEESVVKRIVKRPKMYFFDTGLAAYLCGIDSAETLQRSFLKGRFFETFAFNEIRKTYLNNGELQQLYYYRDSDQNEIDLVLLRNGVLSCIEIKTGQTFNASATKGFKKLASTKYEKGQNAIVCTANKTSMLEDGTIIIPISSI